jgi:ABC-type uncharacterized transport system permease subunit
MVSSVLDFFLEIIKIGIGYTTVFLLASLGDIYAEKSGIPNLSLEGVMGMGAFLGFYFALIFQNSYMGLLGGILAGAVMGVALSYLVIDLAINQVLAGLSMWLVGMGLSDFLYTLSFSHYPYLVTAPKLPTYFVSSNLIVSVLLNHTLVDYAAFLSVPLLWFFLFKTKYGLMIIAVGEDPKAADAVGTNVRMVRYATLIFSSTMGGIAGSLIALTVGLYQVGMIAGRGWISIGIANFSGFNPAYGLLASLLFGVISALGPSFMVIGYKIPYEFLNMTPFLALIIAVMIVAKKAIFPASHGQPYKRE